MNISLATLIEANECLKLARESAPNGAYIRLLDAQFRLDVEIKLVLENQKVAVAA